jgi:hypothetical protein
MRDNLTRDHEVFWLCEAFCKRVCELQLDPEAAEELLEMASSGIVLEAFNRVGKLLKTQRWELR